MITWNGLTATNRTFTRGAWKKDVFTRKLAGKPAPVYKQPGTKTPAVHSFMLYVTGATPAAAEALFALWMDQEFGPDNSGTISGSFGADLPNTFIRAVPKKQGKVTLFNKEYRVVFRVDFEETEE